MVEGFSAGERWRGGGRAGVSLITFFHLLLDMVFSGLLDVSHGATRRALERGRRRRSSERPCASPEYGLFFLTPCIGPIGWVRVGWVAACEGPNRRFRIIVKPR